MVRLYDAYIATGGSGINYESVPIALTVNSQIQFIQN
jgi:hypothetical protein